MKVRQDEAIVLGTRPYGESDRIVHLFTREEGRVSGFAKAARKSKKRFGNVLEMGAYLYVRYEERGHSELIFLKEASLLEANPFWRKSWITVTCASFAIELALRTLPGKQVSLEKFELLKNFLTGLKDPVDKNHIADFEFQWLKYSGWEPDLKCCSLCGMDLKQTSQWPTIQETYDHYWQHILEKPLQSRKLLNEVLL